MRVGVFMFGGVEMSEVGAGPPAAVDRRFDNETMWEATEQIIDTGVVCDRLGFDSFWLTEHHFQFEGYEVIPNGILIGAILAERTEQIRIGMAFNIVTQWHPLKLAEDFATLHNISGGRAILGVGRGTVPRESEVLGSKVGSFDNPEQAADDALNRRQFDEAMDVMTRALDQETFSYHGEVYQFPPPGIPDRGGFVEELTLVPRPLYPYEVWQPISSPPTLEAVPKRGWGGVMWNNHHSFVKARWERFGEVYEETHGRSLDRGEKRMLALSVCVDDNREAAINSVRDGHDEFWKFLGPYGWSKGYMGPDGKPSKAGLIPTLEESMEQKTMIVGSADEVAEQIAWYDELIGLEELMLFPAMPGDSYQKVEEQLGRLASDVLPQLG